MRNTLPEDAEVGLLCSMNSGLVPDALLEKLSDGGLVIANDWHGSASDMVANKPELELVCAADLKGDRLTAEDARDAIRQVEFAIGPGGGAQFDPEEINKVRELPGWTITSMEQNPDYLWVFRKVAGRNISPGPHPQQIR